MSAFWNFEVLTSSFRGLWEGIFAFLPQLVVALIVFIGGWLLATLIGKAVDRATQALKLDNILQSVGVESFLDKAGFRLDAGAFIGGLVRWFLIIVFLIASLDVLGLTEVTDLLREIVNYLPSVFVATVILISAAYVAEIVKRLVVGSAKAVDAPSAHLLGGVAKWSIWVFAILAALFQLGIVGVLAQTLFTGVVAMLTIAGGLAFGLGGKEAAAQYIEKLRKDINKK